MTTQTTFDQTLDADTKLRWADFEENYLSKYIAIADTKAGFGFSLNAGLMAFLLSKSAFISEIKPPEFSILAWAALLFPAVAGWLCLRVILPRTSPSGEGIIFWESIGEFASEYTFAQYLGSLTKDQLVDARVSHCFALANVAKKKYRQLRVGLLLGAFSVILCGAQTIAMKLEPVPARSHGTSPTKVTGTLTDQTPV